jgi:hypothetical protein
MKSTLLTAALLVALAGTASAANNNFDTYNRLDNSVPADVAASRNDCVNRILSPECPLTDMGKNNPASSGHVGTGATGATGGRGAGVL